MKTSFWIKRKNVTPKIFETLHFWGYKQNQEYFDEEDWDILMTTHHSKKYILTKYEYANNDFNPKADWLNERQYIETSEEMIDKINDVG